MAELLDIHQRFISDTIRLNKYGEHILTIIPSVIFLATNFVIIYKFCHRYTAIGFTPLKSWIFRELTFQWTFFYLTKLWYIFLRAYKIFVSYLCMNPKNKKLIIPECDLIGLFVLSAISVTPFVIYLLKTCSRHRIPNFLMWVGEDPWLRTEIGLAGHYLDRPPHFLVPRRHDCSYHTRRSSSAEATPQRGTFLRPSKSLDTSKLRRLNNPHAF